MKKTKIVCTIGPASSDFDTMKKMIRAGMNVARFNMSHGTHESHLKMINTLKQAREELGAPVAIMIDLKGPEIRIKQFEEGKVVLKRGQKFVLTSQDIVGHIDGVSVTYKKFPAVVDVGTRVLLNDGFIELKVIDKNKDSVLTEVVVGGVLSNNKSINLPGIDLDMPFLSDADKLDLEFAKYVDADIVSLSFVSKKQDVIDVKRFLNHIGASDVLVVSKIENNFGIENIEEILAVSDGIMVARGDMGVEIDYEKIPAIQKRILSLCKENGKLSITATQMLESMINSPRPTRAEISDVANACIDGSSCVMLSGETSAGTYPVESVRAMSKIIEESEKNFVHKWQENFVNKNNVSASIGYAACNLASSLDVNSILVVTKSGLAAESISRFRPRQIILACTPNLKTYYKMAACWGVIPLLDKEYTNTAVLLDSAKDKAVSTRIVKKDELFVEVAGVNPGESGINFVRVEKY